MKVLHKTLKRVIPFHKRPKCEVKNKYGLTEEDLIGDIEGFPLEIIEKMLERQEEQGNKVDVSVFQENRRVSWQRSEVGGFDWENTPEGFSFWKNVITFKNFNLFFD